MEKARNNHVSATISEIKMVEKNPTSSHTEVKGVGGEKREHKDKDGKSLHRSEKSSDFKNHSNANNTHSGTSTKHKDSSSKPKENVHNSKDVKQKENSISSAPKDGCNSINKLKDSHGSKKPVVHKSSSSETPENKNKDQSLKLKGSSKSSDSLTNSSNKPKESLSNSGSSSKHKDGSIAKDTSSTKPKDSSSVIKKHKEGGDSASKKTSESSSASANTKNKESTGGGSLSSSSKPKESTGSTPNKPKDVISKPKEISNNNKVKDSGEKSSSHSSSSLTASSKLKSSTDKLNNSTSKTKESEVKSIKPSSKSADKTEVKKSSSTSNNSSDNLKKHEKHIGDMKIKKEGDRHVNKENVDRKESFKDKSKENLHKDSSEKLIEKVKKKDTKEKSDVKIKTEPKEKLSASADRTSSCPPIPQIESLKQSLKLKIEPLSDDDVPLAARKSVGTTGGHDNRKDSKHQKRPAVIDSDSEDEPLAIRLEKSKKVRKEDVKKRKAETDFKEPSLKKMKRDIASKTSPTKNASPTKRKKEEETQEVWKWWEEDKYDNGVKWKTLEHKGPVFAPDYEPLPKNVKFYYKGKHLELSHPAEEVATFYSKLLDHEYTTKEAFNKNFFKDWRKTMTADERELIMDLKACNFTEMHKYFLQKNEERKNMTKEEKLDIKKKNEELQKEYGFCIIDGHKEKIGNFKIEPPGLFRGRGEHPKMGKLKKRTLPEHVIINCGKGSAVPKPPQGHKWKEVRHDNTVTWLACWQENVQGQTKYIMLNPSSKLKGEKDWQKYETARKLKTCVDSIRATYRNDWKSKEMKVRQRAVALYFIDKLALRAGNEKEEGETADTVGCCSLRVEHITLDEEKDGDQCVVSFDFLGKDSIRYVNSVPVEKRVFKNLQLFMENKQPGDDLFDRLNTAILNKHLNELMDGLTAKVFRTFNASKTLQEQLDLLTNPDDPIPAKILSYNRANRAVAVLCNHQRAVPKTFGKSMENLQTKIQAKEDQVKEAEKDLKMSKKDYKSSRAEKDRTLVDRKEKALNRLKDQLMKLELQATDKEENKQIALGTSKLNYLDPRITVAWCKKWDVPVEKVYNRTQRDKFRWAIEMAGPEFVF